MAELFANSNVFSRLALVDADVAAKASMLHEIILERSERPPALTVTMEPVRHRHFTVWLQFEDSESPRGKIHETALMFETCDPSSTTPHGNIVWQCYDPIFALAIVLRHHIGKKIVLRLKIWCQQAMDPDQALLELEKGYDVDVATARQAVGLRNWNEGRKLPLSCYLDTGEGWTVAATLHMQLLNGSDVRIVRLWHGRIGSVLESKVHKFLDSTPLDF